MTAFCFMLHKKGMPTLPIKCLEQSKINSDLAMKKNDKTEFRRKKNASSNKEPGLFMKRGGWGRGASKISLTSLSSLIFVD